MPETIAESAVEHGEVFTRRWVVELILDLADYVAERDLSTLRALEPACGAGAFVGPMTERLACSLIRHGRGLSDASTAIRAMDLLPENVDRTRAVAVKALVRAGFPEDEASEWAKRSIICDDYLLAPNGDRSADVVVGNPPYIRLEDIPPDRYDSYRAASPAMGGRADIYVGFFDKGLNSLRDNGRLVFICADRWMRNDYGRLLRRKVASGPFSVDSVLVAHGVDAFEEQVSAYPAITAIRRGDQAEAVLAVAATTFGEKAAPLYRDFVQSLSRDHVNGAFRAARLPGWFKYDLSWPEGSPELLNWLERLEQDLPTIEEAGGKIGIGVATGCDAVYVADANSLPDVEPDRLLPMAHAADLKSGTFRWTGKHLVNPWSIEDRLVSLEDYPRLARYLHEHLEAVGKRRVARSNPNRWWRTIDKVTHSLVDEPKLLLEDMKARANPVLEPGGKYPHHNLYWVVSRESGWDIEALGGLLLSEAVETQVRAFCVKMRGGTLRFQAQYLRRVRIPRWVDVPAEVQEALTAAFRARDRASATRAALSAYGLDELPV